MMVPIPSMGSLVVSHNVVYQLDRLWYVLKVD